MQNSLFLSFGSGVTDKTFKFNERKKSVRTISLKAYTVSGANAGLFVVDMTGFSPIIATEGFTGAPMPLIGTGEVYTVPLPLFNCAQNAVWTLRVKLRNLDQTPLVHTGFNMWLTLDSEPQPYDLQMVGAEQFVNIGSGAGKNDERWDWVPSSPAEAQQAMHDRFSKLNNE